jgi:hypothetical protein
MTLPYTEPLVPREPGERVIPEPPRRGEAGGPPCGICGNKTTSAVWSDDNWTLHPPVGGSLPGAVWLASRVHVDSFSDLPEPLQADFGRVAARVERAILSLGDMVEASGMMLPLWEDVLPNVPDEDLAAAAERVAAAM